jgi:hypothetical protein
MSDQNTKSYRSTNQENYSRANLASFVQNIPHEFISFEGCLHAPIEWIQSGKVLEHSLIRIAQPLSHGNPAVSTRTPLFHPIHCDRGVCGEEGTYCGFYNKRLIFNIDEAFRVFGNYEFERILIDKIPCGILLDHAPNGNHIKRYLIHYINLGYIPEELEVLTSQRLYFDGHSDIPYELGDHLQDIPSSRFSPEVIVLNVHPERTECQIDFSSKVGLGGDLTKLKPLMSLVESFGFSSA